MIINTRLFLLFDQTKRKTSMCVVGVSEIQK